MHEMINGGGFIPDDGLGTEQETQDQGYDIDGEPLFEQYDHTMGQVTAVDDDTSNEGELAMDESGAEDAHAGDGKKKSQRTAGYTGKEDQCLCRSWLAISQDPIYGAEQKRNSYWRKVTQDFHERRQLAPFRIHSDRGQNSIQKRRGYIQQDTNKFCTAIDHVLSRPVSGLGTADVVRPRPF
jgi:hypothetical protein